VWGVFFFFFFHFSRIYWLELIRRWQFVGILFLAKHKNIKGFIFSFGVKKGGDVAQIEDDFRQHRMHPRCSL